MIMMLAVSGRRELVRRIDRGVTLVAWTPIALAAGLPLGFLLVLVWMLFNPGESVVGLVIGLSLGCAGAVACFVVGALRLTRPIAGRPLGPLWARLGLRYVGPLAAALDGVTPIIQWQVPNLGSDLSLVLRAACQVLSLVACAAILRMFQAIEHQTQAGRGATVRYWYGWTLLVVLALIWGVVYWWLPARRGPFGPAFGFSGLDWGGFLLAGAMILEIGVLWSAVDSVAIEWIVATYGKSIEEEPRTIQP